MTTISSAGNGRFMTDEMLFRLGEHVNRGQALAGLANTHFGDIGIAEHDLWLFRRSGYSSGQVEHAMNMCKGQAIEPMPSVAERMKACLFFLGDLRAADVVLNHPEVIHGAQRVLNELLLEHPVLMHPRLKVQVFANGDRGLCSVAHAVAMARHGRFPMAGDTDVTPERLTQWAINPCVHLGFTTPSIEGYWNTPAVARGSRPIEASAKQCRGIEWTLASVDHLAEIYKASLDGHMDFADYITPVDFRGKRGGEGLATYTASFFSACGVFDGTPCPAFFGVLNRLHYGENNDLRESIVNRSAAYLLGGDGAEVAGDITYRFDAIVKGLIACEFAPGPVEAAQMIWGRVADQGTRQVTVAEALEVIRCVRAAGATVTVSKGAFGTAANVEPWAHALEVHNTAQAMNHIIDQVSSPTTADATAPRRRHGL